MVNAPTTAPIATDPGPGLTSTEAQARLKQFGPNAVVEDRQHPVRNFLKRFWAPIPWLLEASIIIQLFLGENVEAAVIGALLILNALLSWFQEGRAQKALALLRRQLQVQARVRRDNAWTTLPAEELVPGDVVHLRQGSIVPADVRVDEGSLLADQSALTGESAAVSVEKTRVVYAGSMIRGGEATGEVTATGARTFFGKTAELVRHRGIGQPAGTRNRRGGQKPLCRERRDGGDCVGLRPPPGHDHRLRSPADADYLARFHSRRSACHVHARRGAWLGGIVEAA